MPCCILDSRAGITSYLCGATSRFGGWWYFPFRVLLKTTLALLALFVLGAFVTRATTRWTMAGWAGSALAMIAVAMTSSLDIGVRFHSWPPTPPLHPPGGQLPRGC